MVRPASVIEATVGSENEVGVSGIGVAKST